MLLKEYSLKKIENKFKSETDVRVRERLQMILHLREGYTQREVSSMLRVSTGLVPYWKKRFETEGFIGFKDKEGRGVKPKITDNQLSMLRSTLEEPIRMKNGYSRGWTQKDVRIFISENFYIDFTRQHVCRTLHKIGCSLQVPRPRNKSRNQENVDKFRMQLKKNEKNWAPNE